MTRQQKIDAAVSLICSRQYGDGISHAEIAQCIGEHHKSQKYRNVIDAVKKRCVDNGKMIQSIRGYGYQIIRPDDYTEVSVKRIVSGAKQIDKGVKILAHAPVSQMTQPGLEAYRRTSDRVQILQASLAGATVEINMLSRRRNPLLPSDT